MSGKILVSIQEESNKELWLFFCRRGEESTSYFLRLKLDGGTEVSLIEQEENRIIFRYGLKGTYTRVKTFEEDYPAIDEAKNLFQEYAEEYSASLTEDKDKVEKPAKVHEEKIKHAARDTKKLKRKLKTFKASFEKMKSQRVTIDDLKQLEEKALQLQNHLYLVQEGMESLQLGPEQGLDEDLIIELDPERAPGLNLKDYFIRLSKKKKSFQINEKRFAEVEQNIRNLDELRTKLDQEILSIHSLEKISENWSLGKVQNSQKNKTLERLPYKTFIDEQGVKYFVGKTAKDSDALVKKAKSHDLWFHVVGSTGSHVIVPFAFIKKLKSREEVQKECSNPCPLLFKEKTIQPERFILTLKEPLVE